jgi:uncharacterized tellurite resistance protein B-like protein
VTAIDLSLLQARRDRGLRDALQRDRGVERAMEKFRERASGYGFRHRRELLAGALRLNRAMAPTVSNALAECREVLGVSSPIEIFVRPDPTFGAFCAKNPAGPVMIGLTSRLLEVFTPAELKFVIGHELGHVAFDHFGIPMPITATIEDVGGALVSRATQLQLFVWCRAAEVSADRAGLLCARDPDVAGRAFFKLASGVASDAIRPDLDAFIKQVESLASAPAARVEDRNDDDLLDCFSTHPYAPSRVRALLAFGRSATYRSLTGLGAGDVSNDALEEIVERDLAIMEPTYLEEKTALSVLMRRLLYCGGVSVAAVTEGISEREVGALRALLGEREAQVPSDVPTLEKTVKELEEKLDQANREVPLGGRLQLVQHLTLIAAADGNVDRDEHAEILRIAGRLGVDAEVVEQTLRGAAAPMD